MALDDGWKIEPITGAEQLAVHAMLMKHCALEYAPSVSAGRSFFYELLNHDGVPTVTVELADGKVAQALGKRNRAPAKADLKRLESWRKRVLDSPPRPPGEN